MRIKNVEFADDFHNIMPNMIIDIDVARFCNDIITWSVHIHLYCLLQMILLALSNVLLTYMLIPIISHDMKSSIQIKLNDVNLISTKI